MPILILKSIIVTASFGQNMRQDTRWDTSNSSISKLFDFHSRRDLPIYLPSNVESKKGESRVLLNSDCHSRYSPIIALHCCSVWNQSCCFQDWAACSWRNRPTKSDSGNEGCWCPHLGKDGLVFWPHPKYKKMLRTHCKFNNHFLMSRLSGHCWVGWMLPTIQIDPTKGNTK